jgi:hypothetical protein
MFDFGQRLDKLAWTDVFAFFLAVALYKLAKYLRDPVSAYLASY